MVSGKDLADDWEEVCAEVVYQPPAVDSFIAALDRARGVYSTALPVDRGWIPRDSGIIAMVPWLEKGNRLCCHPLCG